MATSTAFLEDAYQKAVDAEVSQKSTSLSNFENNAKQYQREIAAYEELRIRLQNLSQASRDLYGFRSPFRNFIGTGDGIPDYFTVIADRNAADTKHTIEIKQLAQSQKFSSRAYSMTDKLPEGIIKFKIGETEKTVNFGGGNLLNLQQAITKAFGKDIKVTITQKSRTLQVMTLDLVKTGSANTIEVVEDSAGILTELNMFTKRPYRYLGHVFNETLLKKWKDESDNLTTNYFVKNDFLVLQGANKLSIPLSKEAAADSNITMSLTIRVNDKQNPVEDIPPPLIPTTVTLSVPDTGLVFNKVDSVKYKDVELYGEGLSPADNNRTFEEAKRYNELLEKEKLSKAQETPIAPEPVDQTGFNSELIGVKYIDKKGNEREKFFAIATVSSSWQRLSIPIGGQFEEGDIIIDAILINKNTDYDVYYKDILIENSAKTEDAPNFLIEEAQDARIAINDIDVLSDINEFQKVVNGLTITAKKVTPNPIEVTIEINKEEVINTVVIFIRSYNEVIDFLNDGTMRPLSRDIYEGLNDMDRTALIDLLTAQSVEYNIDMSDSALKKKIYFIGVFSGNSIIATLSQKIKAIVAAPYPTKYGADLALLDQVGIKKGLDGDTWETVRKGFLQVDEEQFMQKIETQIDGVAELFASSTTGADIPNTGVGFSMNDVITPYSQTRGILDNTIAVNKSKLKENADRITKEKEKIDAFRQSRVEAYYRMQSELKNAERERTRLENTFKAQQGQ